MVHPKEGPRVINWSSIGFDLVFDPVLVVLNDTHTSLLLVPVFANQLVHNAMKVL